MVANLHFSAVLRPHVAPNSSTLVSYPTRSIAMCYLHSGLRWSNCLLISVKCLGSSSVRQKIIKIGIMPYTNKLKNYLPTKTKSFECSLNKSTSQIPFTKFQALQLMQTKSFDASYCL